MSAPALPVKSGDGKSSFIVCCVNFCKQLEIVFEHQFHTYKYVSLKIDVIKLFNFFKMQN